MCAQIRSDIRRSRHDVRRRSVFTFYVTPPTSRDGKTCDVDENRRTEKRHETRGERARVGGQGERFSGVRPGTEQIVVRPVNQANVARKGIARIGGEKGTATMTRSGSLGENSAD